MPKTRRRKTRFFARRVIPKVRPAKWWALGPEGVADLRQNLAVLNPLAYRWPSYHGRGRVRGKFHFARRYLTLMLVLVCLIVVSVFWGFGYRAGKLIENQLHYQGRAFLQEIILTREWAASYGGVYVEMKPGVDVNPFLRNIPNLQPVLKGEDGKRYTLKNPALITREISGLTSRKGIISFNITSAAGLNPANQPDAFERTALAAFERGQKEYSAYENRGNEVLFRYMVPLRTETSCLRCHTGGRYRAGNVQGGISVTIPATPMLEELRRNRIGLAASAFAIVALVIAVFRFISDVLIKRLKSAEQKLVEMASRDFLTGLLNRREMFNLLEREISRADRHDSPLSLIIMDIDFFKKINDTYGHSAGDAVLKFISGQLLENMREHDLLCRYGGEEFLIAAPETTAEMAYTLVNRLQSVPLHIALDDDGGGASLKVNFSAGIAQRLVGEALDKTISRADAALYRAKKGGRNRIELAVCPA